MVVCLSTIHLTYDFTMSLTQEEAEQLIESLNYLKEAFDNHTVAFTLRKTLKAHLQEGNESK